jgi:outer membrane protein
MTAVRRWTSIICLSLTAISLSAQTTTTTTTTQTQTTVTAAGQRATQPVTAETDKDLTDPNAMKLSLQDVFRTSMERNLGIALQSYDYRMAGESLRGQYGLYDWFASGTLSRAKVKGTSLTGGTSTNETDVADIGVAQNLPAGGNYFLGFNNSKQGESFSPNLTLQATQPLLRNFGIDVTRRNILVARNTLGINREAFRLALMNASLTVEQAYLDLVYARRNVEVVKESLFLARDQSRITQIRIDVGASAPLDILQPRVQIATTEEQLISAVALVRSAEDRLRAVMNLPLADWSRPIIPTDPVDYAPVKLDMDSAVTRAMELRPELRQAELTNDIRRISYLYAKNQVLPQLDLNLSYRAGTSRTIQGFDPLGNPIFTTPSYSQGLQQVGNFSFPAWSVGVTVGVPILNIGARAERKRAQLDVEASRVTQAQTAQDVTIAVRSAARDVDTAARTIVASTTAREAAEQNLDAERRRFENGMSTNFQVLTIQQQLSDARVRELQAQVGFAEALANYHRQVGDILDIHNIAVDEPAVSSEPKVFSRLDRYNWLNYGPIGTMNSETIKK